MQNKNNNRNAGYTIIETMIAISLFIIIVMMGMNSLLNANLLHQKSQSMRSILDNLSFIMEDMGRNIRTGYNYQCYNPTNTTLTLATTNANYPRSCASGWAIVFEPSGGNTASYGHAIGNPPVADQWVYYIGTNPKDSSKYSIFKSIDGAQTFIQLTPDEVVIDPVSSFSVLGAEPPSSGDQQQPFVTIKLVGTITSNNVVSPFFLQTSISQRVIDI